MKHFVYICLIQHLTTVEKSLIVTQNNHEIFSSQSKWLYPLFELEDFIKAKQIVANDLFLTDKIAGKAAAYLIVRLGFKNIHIQLISEGAISVFNRFGVQFTYDELVPKIQCKTEDIVNGDEPFDAVWQMLRRRAGRVAGLIVDIRELSVEIDNKLVLNNLMLRIERGEHVFIKGLNGAGKTTLLKAILGLEKISSGSIQIGDYLVGSREWEKNRSIVGYVHQEMVKNTFPISAAEVVGIGFSAQKLSKAEKAHRLEISMRRTGCFHLANRSFHELSGGEKQRLNIARCLCQQARVMLFDEPTSFLDGSAKDELFDLLNEIWANEAPTAIIVSHDDQWIERFKWPVYELNEGKIC